MAQAPHLENCSAEDFSTTWRKYDEDRNGYIEEQELENFLSDLAKKDGQTDIKKFQKTFMSNYDKNKDGKIDMKELAEVLKPEENFLFLIRTEEGPDSVEFKKIWKKYDTDNSRFIEAAELKSFLKDVYKSCGKSLSAEKLDKYTKAALDLYDRDDNHKLDFKEMTKLLPLANNYLTDLKFDELSDDDFKVIFGHYDRNKDQTIEGSELDALFADLLRKDGKPAEPATITKLKKSAMQHCDTNKDGKIQFSELALLLKFKL